MLAWDPMRCFSTPRLGLRAVSRGAGRCLFRSLRRSPSSRDGAALLGGALGAESLPRGPQAAWARGSSLCCSVGLSFCHRKASEI